MSSEECRLNHTLGRAYGPDVVQLDHLVTWIRANLRLGKSMTITIDKYGKAMLEAEDE